ncbi:hypothetical protein P154DRAFT_259093 [Amniculicola lignicola CBS 123094]|uniref:1-alkyl-2-acetylglycerophosphocholine esterase n=1 Tax=Amniculicola lignicola CBS 123094 TaxID=1392246 RepID=A0A6A5WX98_9PLEO|nr:hypothetical protein P154DRAFT_259093 [Amniculicola lignicola CBS 123094]
MHQSSILLAILSLWTFRINSKAVLPVVGPKRFDVAITSFSLTDSDRLDPFANDGRKRSIVVSGFNPTARCQRKQLQLYMPPATALFQDDKFSAYGLPNGSFQSLYLEVCQKRANRSPCSAGAHSFTSLPLAVFSGALGTSRLIYSSMLQSVAAAGYLVVSVDHPYDADIVEFPDGTTITGIDIESDTDVDLALNTRSEDIRFLIRQFANSDIVDKLFPGNIPKQHDRHIAAIGHSLGGAAAADAMLHDPSIAAAINIDGTMFGQVLAAGLDRAFMLIGHENKTQDTDPSWKTVWPLLKGWKKELEVKGAAHYSFSDLPLVTTVLGLQDRLPEEVELVLGNVEGHRMAEIEVALVTSFLGSVFKSRSGGEFGDELKEFPEVVDVA